MSSRFSTEIIKKSREVEEDLKDLGDNEDEAGDSSRLIYRALQSVTVTDQVLSIIDGSGEEVNISEVTGDWRWRCSHQQSFLSRLQNILE